MKTIQLEYNITRTLYKDFEVSDEVFDEWNRTGNDSLLGIDWAEVFDECDCEYANTECFLYEI